MGDAASADPRRDAATTKDEAVLVVVVAAVGEQPTGPAAGPAPQAPNRRDQVQQRQQLRDVVPVPAGQCDGERNAVAIDDQVVLAARPAPVARRRSGVHPPLSALTCEPSTAQSSISSRPAALSSVNRTSCRRGHTPASVQFRSRRQAVTPLHPVRSAGTSRQLTPLHSTYTIPRSAARSSAGSRPGQRRQQRSHPLPQVRHKIMRHMQHSAARTPQLPSH